MTQGRLCGEGGPSDFRSSLQAPELSHREWKGRCRFAIPAFAGTVKRADAGQAGTARTETSSPRERRNVR
jgi:hypothetical protein